MARSIVGSVGRQHVDQPLSAWSHPSGSPAPPADNSTHGGWSNGQAYYNCQQPYPCMMPSGATPSGQHQQLRSGRGGRVPHDT